MVDAKDEWTVGTLREYIIALIAANDARYTAHFDASLHAVDAAFAAQQAATQASLTAHRQANESAQAAANQAVTKSEIANEKRFESVNEFRDTLADQQRTLMPRAESELLFRQLSDKIEVNNAALIALTGKKSGMHEGWVYLLGGISILSLLVSIVFHFVK